MATSVVPTYRGPSIDEQALIREARRLRRRRWLFGAITVVLLGGGAIGCVIGFALPNSPRHAGVVSPLSRAAGSSRTRSKASQFGLSPYIMPGVFGFLSGTEIWAANGLHFYLSRNGRTWSLATIPGLGGDLATSLRAVDASGIGTYAVAMINSRSYGTCGHFEAPNPIAPPPEYSTSAVAITANDGRSWTRAVMPKCGVVSSLSLANARVGFALTFPGGASSATPTLLDETSDGGISWHVVGPAPKVNEVVFASAEVGLGISSFAQTNASLDRTSDGGRTWTRVELPVPTEYRRDDVAVGVPTFFGDEDGIVDLLPESSTNQMTKRVIVDITHDGGKSWTSAESTASPAIPSYGPSSSAGDGLIPWQLVPFSAVSTKTWVLLLGPTLYETTNGGKSWTKRSSGEHWIAGSIAQIAFTSATRGWAFANSQVFSTVDGGLVWQAISNATPSRAT